MKHQFRYYVLILVLLISAGTFAQAIKIKQQHQVKKKETLYGIAKVYGITVVELMNANPEMKIKGYELKKGDYINIPFSNDVQVNASTSLSSQKAQTNNVKRNKSDVVKVGVMLPLHNTNGDGKRMVEYYRGLLMACERLKVDDISVDLYAWDVSLDANIHQVLKEKNAERCDIIFGPLYTSMVKPLADFCKKNHIKLVIPFSISGEPARDYEQVFQVYQSDEEMGELTIKRFFDRFAGYHPVLVDCNDATSDKGKFTAELRKAFADRKINYSLTNLKTSDADFAKAFSLTQRNVIVLNTARSPELNATFAKLNTMFAKGNYVPVSMLGYKEWLMYNHVYQELFCKYDAYIPTNFFYNPVSVDTRWVESNYRKWFNEEMIVALPHFALTGFDHGCFFIGGFSKFGKAFHGGKGEMVYRPVQSPLLFKKEGKGRKNSTFMLVHYKNDKTIEAISY